VESVKRFLARLGPNLVIVLTVAFFVLPLIAMARFALQSVPMVKLGWSTLFDNWSLRGLTAAFEDDAFAPALWLSLKLALGTALLTLALLIPTAVWVHLRLPRLRPVIEFVSVLPYMIPAIGLVAGILVLKPRARWFLNSDLSLIPFYVVLTLPFTYRALDTGLRSIDLVTLVDASRSLGAGWTTTLRRVLIPNLRASIISASFLTVAVVIGEYTLANVLLKRTLPAFMQEFRGREPQGGYGLALLALFATVLLFALLGLLTRPKGARRSRSAEPPSTTYMGVAG
jgi:putative spermidine/putrescine transport system permease protein